MTPLFSEATTESDARQLAALRLPLGAWLRLLWNVTPPLLHRRAAELGEGAPFLTESGVHLPPAPFACGDAAAASQWYSAAAAHAAAHIVFSRRVFAREGTAPITQALLGLLEDARVEALACRELPGLRRLWAPLHTVRPEDGDDFETLMLRLARALVDPAYDDPHPWVRKGRARFYLDSRGEVMAQARPAALRELASALGHDLGQMRMAFNPRTYRPGPSYRDDNRWLWHAESDAASSDRSKPSPAAARVAESMSSPMPPESMQWRYPEWDRLPARLRPDWCTVREQWPTPAARGPVAPGATDVPEDRAMQRRLTLAMRKAAAGGRPSFRREREGDEIVLDEAVRAMLSARSGNAANERIYRRLLRAPERIALMLLIDSSASSARPHGLGGRSTQFQMQQRVGTLIAHAAADAGWSLAIQAFDSDGRHGVNHWRVKDFNAPWGSDSAARLAALCSTRSTRIGAALRHAAHMLTNQPATRRHVLLLGDCEPHDVDIHDPRYLIEDARHAVQTARLVGVRCAGLLLDAQGTVAARRIFGGRTAALPAMSMLPHALGRLLAD